MTITIDQIELWVSAFIWPFVRISAMLLVAPVFGARNVNTRIRLAFGLLLALLVAPQLPAPPAVEPLSLDALVVALRQVLIGVAMGFVLQMAFSALSQAGEAIALSMGLGFASVVDPVGGIQVPMVSQFLSILTTLIFLALNGHLILIQVLLQSFETLPIATGAVQADEWWALVGFGSTMFASGLLIALPLVASLLLINLAMGVVTRAAPQLNLFAVGFPVSILVGFVLLILMLPGLPARIGELLMSAFALVQRIAGL